jgi:hypothetical protein
MRPEGEHVKHAGKDALSRLQGILETLRGYSVLVERTPGSFYWRSKGFVHFHEDPTGLFADFKEDLVSFKRYRVTSLKEQRAFVVRVGRCLKEHDG